jgi:hypothetical protein
MLILVANQVLGKNRKYWKRACIGFLTVLFRNGFDNVRQTELDCDTTDIVEAIQG